MHVRAIRVPLRMLYVFVDQVTAIELVMEAHPPACAQLDSNEEPLITIIQAQYSVLADAFRVNSDKYGGNNSQYDWDSFLFVCNSRNCMDI